MIIGDVTPTINITESATSVDEGGSVTFTISGSNIANGTYYYTISEEEGTIASTDFNPANLDGYFIVNNNSGSLTITLAEDLTSEGTDKFRIQIRRDSVSGNIIATSNAITINDTSTTPGSTANGLTFGPVQVNRDNGNLGYESDWFAICDIDTLPEGSSIALFIDTSGSMTMATIQKSYDKFVAKLKPGRQKQGKIINSILSQFRSNKEATQLERFLIKKIKNDEWCKLIKTGSRLI